MGSARSRPGDRLVRVRVTVRLRVRVSVRVGVRVRFRVRVRVRVGLRLTGALQLGELETHDGRRPVVVPGEI